MIEPTNGVVFIKRLCLSCKHLIVEKDYKICGYTDFDWENSIYKNKKCPLYIKEDKHD